MNLSEKIIHCRKKAGLSQEALSEKIGVSRQAISKWETGTATPELEKLLLLAKEFQVSTDWLLSSEEPASQGLKQDSLPQYNESLPSFIHRIATRYGWIAGLYLFFIGVLVSAMGFIARTAVSRMFPPIEDISGMVKGNPVYLMATAFLIFGGLFMLGGVILAVLLKKGAKQ